MHLKLSYYKLKKDNYNYVMYFEIIMVNIKLKSFIDRQVIKKKQSILLQTYEERQQERKKDKRTTKKTKKNPQFFNRIK